MPRVESKNSVMPG